MKTLLLCLSLTIVKPQPKIIEVCRVVTLQNQVACHKVVVGTFVTKPSWMQYLQRRTNVTF